MLLLLLLLPKGIALHALRVAAAVDEFGRIQIDTEMMMMMIY